VALNSRSMAFALDSGRVATNEIIHDLSEPS
jgi:hypothetical protein